MTDGKLPTKWKNLSGQTFGALTALSPEACNGHHVVWRFRCECGTHLLKVGVRVTQEAKRGGTPNCGCMTGALMSRKLRTHGMSKHPAYAVYSSMLARCLRPSHKAWPNYGGRGIGVCTRWLQSFEAFWEDMGPSYRHGLDLDRTDNSGPYSPENCRWVSRRVNTMNKRNSIALDIPELSRATGIGKTTLYNRLKAGWPLEMLTISPDFKNRCTTSSTVGLDTGSSLEATQDRS
jgi:hypothetical protein